MGMFYVIIGVFGLVVLEFFFHTIAKKNKGKTINSIFAFWKNDNFAGLIGFYLYYLIFVGIVMIVFNIEAKGIFGDFVETLVIALPAIILSMLLKKRNL